MIFRSMHGDALIGKTLVSFCRFFIIIIIFF